MPPKPKLSKAEKEKLKAEEDLRKAAEEEELKAKQEEELKEKKKKEKEEEAEKKKRENEEKKDRRVEMTQLNAILQSNREALQNLHNERRKQMKWNRYMRCDGSPDPTNQGEINTYINLRMEDTEHDDIESVFKASELDTKLIMELNFLLEDTPPEEITDREKFLYNQIKEELQALIKKKMDAATLRLLQEATDRADSETFNLQFEHKSPDVCLSIWGNLSKNPRIKSFEFAKQGLTFEIPRVLCLSDCAIRVLDPKYDHYSPTCKSFYPRQKVKKVETPVEEAKPEEGEENKEEEKKEEEPEEKEKEPTDYALESIDLMAALAELEDGPKEEEEETEKKEEEKEEDIEEYEEPKTPEPLEWEDFEEDEDVVDLRANDIVGGVFHFDLMALPPQPKTMNKWIVTRLVDPPEIEYIDYVADSVTQMPKENQSSGNTPVQGEKRDDKPPIGIAMKLPSHVLFSEEPLIARWDYKKKYWRQDGFTDMSYDEDNRIFSFKTAYFGLFALLQDSHLNMPFQSWELRPHKTNACVLTIIAAIVEVEIEIKDAMCCLSKPDDRPELDGIRNKWVTPKELITIMKEAGINLFPADDSSKYVSIQNKNPIVTNWMYEQMALLSSAMAFSWSKWNSEMDTSDKVLFQGSEALEDEPLLEEDWGVYMATKKRCMKLNCTEFDEEFSEDYAEGTTFRSNLYHTVLTQCSEEAKERILNSSYQYVDCVEQILKATKVLTYS
ncbi:dynein axonemal intermediate chain 7 homolog isoform X2 [Saccostrea echinata]|uniref:dynein axonemal intermediate chain 7 homolog isoform X2 n=1 Tax=Saccostrea echinata TaxID=191078 RepID=UPI002A807175|nr:dynein axonemal intermediate chain 7 homolog isoform X2 [Saccostrea echinata]